VNTARKISILCACGLICAAAQADIYTEAKTMGAMVMETWISGAKKREEAQLPGLGKTVTIIRLDKGVRWDLDVSHQAYTEKTLAMPPLPQNTMKNLNAHNSLPPDKTSCTPLVKQMPEPKVIAGLNTVGYQMGCSEKPDQGVVVWFAPSSQPAAAQLKKETQDFGLAYFKAMNKNQPAKKWEATQADMEAMSKVLKSGRFRALAKNFPQGFMMGMETLQGDQGVMMLEIVGVTTTPNDPALFEIPVGYTKTAYLNTGFPGTGALDPEAMKKLQKQIKDLMKSSQPQ